MVESQDDIEEPAAQRPEDGGDATADAEPDQAPPPAPEGAGCGEASEEPVEEARQPETGSADEPKPDSRAAADESAEPGEAVEPAQQTRIPDFMSEEPATMEWDYMPTPRQLRPKVQPASATEPAQPPPQDAASALAPDQDGPAQADPQRGEDGTHLPEPADVDRPDSDERPYFKPHFAQLRGSDGKLRLGPIVRPGGLQQRRLTRLSFLLVVSVPLLAALAWLLFGIPGVDAPEKAPPRPSSAAPLTAQAGFVTASVLNCRSAPARQARSVRRLARGAAIAILGHDGEWASIAAQGEQCWVLSRYLSTVRPA